MGGYQNKSSPIFSYLEYLCCSTDPILGDKERAGWLISRPAKSTAPMGEVDCGRLGPFMRLTMVHLAHVPF